MTKDFKNPTLICGVLTSMALIGIIAGLYWSIPLIIVLVMILPALYELYRTEGFYTKGISAAILILLIVEIILLFMTDEAVILKYIKDADKVLNKSYLELIDITFIPPLLITGLSFLLLRRAGGKYTFWLAMIMLVTAIALLYSVSPIIFQKIISTII